MKTTIFKQLILNVIIPVVIALSILAFFNYSQTKSLLKHSNEEKSAVITDEIQSILEFQDLALGLIERELDNDLENYSETLVNDYLNNQDSLKLFDLHAIRDELGMDPNDFDIYIINNEGIVVNTTFEQDLNLNFFSFGPKFKTFLQGVMRGNNISSEKFSIEMKTKKLRKYTYQASLNHEYIIEIGNYSAQANEVITKIKNNLKEISKKQESIKSIDLFIGADDPFVLDSSTAVIAEHDSLLRGVFANNATVEFFEENEEGIELHYEYIYMNRENTDLYTGAVIRIISDRNKETAMLNWELIKALMIFVGCIIVVVLLIYLKTKVITTPIKNLVENVNNISGGNLADRAEVIGNNEITHLAKEYNSMLEKLEESYSNLEQKVIDRTAEISRQKEEIEEKNDEILDSIHYAKRIQTAILPPDDFVKKLLPDSFILYKPKDIVSGDFYWAMQKEDQALFAAVDCTGHGVPGAFMSIVGNDQLNNAVNIKGEIEPAKILDALNEGVTQSFRQNKDSESAVRDGMDIAICKVDYKHMKLDFAGAYNPLYRIRDGEFHEIKGNKFPIGSLYDDELQKFTNHELKLERGDTFYIFSDGYADQFGGPKGKKFKYRQFKELLMEIQDFPMEEQKEILNTRLEDWRGEEEQVDDIIIIGIRI